MIINVQDILRIEPKLESRKSSTLNITCHLTEGQLEKLFYGIWDDVGNDKLNEWLAKEDMKLTHKL
jgi:hypothetical protein